MTQKKNEIRKRNWHNWRGDYLPCQFDCLPAATRGAAQSLVLTSSPLT